MLRLLSGSVLALGLFAASANAQTCTFSLSSPAIYLDAAAQAGSVKLTSSAQTCVWNASSGSGFITITSPASGVGNGTASFTVPANTSGADITGSITVAGQTIPVTQRFATTTFGDVFPSDFFFDAVGLLKGLSITAGCSASPALFCPNANIPREEMAVFVIRSIYGSDNFTYSSTPWFIDVPANYQYFKWIQKVKDLGITAGCTATAYCPDDLVTRDQMATFLIRARYGASTTFSYPSTPYFTDVPPSDNFFKWVQKLKQIGITAGCTATTYCPNDPVTRGEMAILVLRGSLNRLLPAAAPLITKISPTSTPQGTSASVTITGVNTNFVQGATQVSAGGGITVSNVTVTSPTTLTATFTVAAGAATAPASVIATTGNEEAVLPNAFTVTPTGVISSLGINPRLFRSPSRLLSL